MVDLLSFGKTITHAPHGLDEFRLVGVGFNFGAQAVDVRVDRVFVAGNLVTPDLVEQLLAAVGAARPCSKESQKVKFFGGQFDALAVQRHLPIVEVDL